MRNWLRARATCLRRRLLRPQVWAALRVAGGVLLWFVLPALVGYGGGQLAARVTLSPTPKPLATWSASVATPVPPGKRVVSCSSVLHAKYSDGSEATLHGQAFLDECRPTPPAQPTWSSYSGGP